MWWDPPSASPPLCVIGLAGLGATSPSRSTSSPTSFPSSANANVAMIGTTVNAAFFRPAEQSETKVSVPRSPGLTTRLKGGLPPGEDQDRSFPLLNGGPTYSWPYLSAEPSKASMSGWDGSGRVNASAGRPSSSMNRSNCAGEVI
jgi:hypothetical protein